MSESEATLRVERDDRGIVTVTMDRPDVRNAFDADLIARLRETFEGFEGEPDVRAVVLTGAGRVFSAGADLNWMKGMVDRSFEENVGDSRELEAMLRAVYDCPRPVVARVHGHAFGGGTGLVACSDIAIANRGAHFAFSEVRLGVAPAVISPYVFRRIGPTSARHLFLTGERFDARRAREIGLVNLTVEPEDIDDAVEEVLEELLAGGPQAQTEIKTLLRELYRRPDLDDAADYTTETIARLRASAEGQEGMSAFLDRRDPSWAGADGPTGTAR
jgi:methylglutaconyl-CoA hydratase